MMLIRLWIAASVTLGAALSAQAQTTGADLVGEWTAKQAIEERCHIHLGRGSFRIAPASRPGVFRLSGRLSYRSAVRPECQGTARVSKKAARNTASNCQVVSNMLVCKSRRGSRTFEIGAKSLVSSQRTPDGANVTTILRQAARRAAAPAAKDTSDRESRQAAPRKFHSKYQQASGMRPALPESAANTALALRVQKVQNHLDKAAESLFRADLAATSSTTTQANELAKARTHLAEYDALAPSLAIPAAVRNPVLKNTSTVVLAHLGKMNRQVRHYLTTSEVLHRAALENASPSAKQNAAHVLDGRLTRAGQKAVAARELVGLPYYQESDYFLALALTMMTEAGASLFEGLKSGDNAAAVRNWAVDVRERTLVGRRAVAQARRQEKKSNASLALIPDPGLKAKFAEFMRLGSRYNDLLDEALRELEKASHDLEAGRLEADAVVAIDANFNFPLEPLLGRLSALTTELSRLQ